jgi:hypothetical protein
MKKCHKAHVRRTRRIQQEMIIKDRESMAPDRITANLSLIAPNIAATNHGYFLIYLAESKVTMRI